MELSERKARAELLRGREARRFSTTLETRLAGDGRLQFRGVASSTESPYDMGYYQETIKRGAFTKTLSERPDVQLVVNHEGLPLARTTNGSLTLRESDVGLEFDAWADADDPDAARVARKVEAGLMDQCSFAFRVIRQTWDEDYTDRQIEELSLDRGDVSIVNYGANPNTQVGLRSLFADLKGYSDEELAVAKEDAEVLTIIRRMGFELPAIVTPEIETDEPAVYPVQLDVLRAHVDALQRRGRQS